MKHRSAGAFKIDTLIYDDKKLDAEIEGIARNIIQERESQGLSISELAARSNLSISAISKGETGKSTFSLRSLIKIAAALNVPVRKLLQVKDYPDIKGNKLQDIIITLDEPTVRAMLKIAESIIERSRKQDEREENS
ncbi:MAG: helix-turn-helix transcriptional regulator [Roseburia sp.]|nr:helix-turn-helix transcriptional regulator [Roseburia sp.]